MTFDPLFPQNKNIDSFPMGLRSSEGTVLSLQRKLNSSGEGSIYATEDPRYFAKIYHNPSLEKAKKLQTMLLTPPSDPTASQGHISIAWPIDILLNKQGAVQGFLMPKIRGGMDLTHVYNPRLRRQKAPEFNWYYLHTTALNVAWILKALHDKTFIVGDLKPENFLVNNKALVTILDTDSFQIYDQTNQVLFLSPVGSEGFTPPELIGKNLNLETRSEIHDRFGLAVLIYFLLFGVHPFSGVWKGQGEPPSLDMRIFQGLSPFSSPLLEPSPLVPPLSILPPFLKDAFKQTFDKGHLTPTARLSASDWMTLLKKSLSLLETCPAHLSHFYYPSQGHCPWCLHLLKTNVDLFPTNGTQDKNNAFLIAKQFESFLKVGDILKAGKVLTLLKINCDPALLKSYENMLEETSSIMETFEKFSEALKKGREKDRELLTLWKNFSFKTHPLVQRPLPLFEDKSLQDCVQRSQTRQDLLKEINLLLKEAKASHQSPLSYFDDLLRLWNKDLFEEDEKSESCSIASLMPEAHEAFKTYTLLKPALLNHKTEEVLLLWSPIFEHRLKRDGLFEPLQRLLHTFFQPFMGKTIFKATRTHKKEGLLVHLQFQPIPVSLKSLTPHLKHGIFLSFSKDFKTPLFISQKKLDFLGNTIFIPFSASEDPISPLYIRPAFVLGEIFLGSKNIVSLDYTSPPVEIFLSTSFSKSSFFKPMKKTSEPSPFLKIRIKSSHSIELPTLLIKGGVSRVALLCDTEPDAFVLGEISPCLLEENTPLDFEIPIGEEIPKNLLNKLKISLEPKEKKAPASFFFS
ncbi:MAG: hypothetical protein B7Y25_06425 [Alphaproteobacteria bacterium 16-39-46]|nr:MAG: hypothetical protein B7Y25_06425 [Alphaproteobacteria bacterium 16-39-46]OZA42311.1 MAG: hypothetical protein B7X84_06495 [Alphaproteobacteria bacterium 17-39-52]HQS84532.1 hypothetical protein [Alphaproteobacteria bacterium]HQS94325.1 hypothetical protein [Alphaproteobacteria bacterium]